MFGGKGDEPIDRSGRYNRVCIEEQKKFATRRTCAQICPSSESEIGVAIDYSNRRTGGAPAAAVPSVDPLSTSTISVSRAAGAAASDARHAIVSARVFQLTSINDTTGHPITVIHPRRKTAPTLARLTYPANAGVGARHIMPSNISAPSLSFRRLMAKTARKTFAFARRYSTPSAL